MKLYLIRPNEDLPKDDNPWEPWYDKAFGFVVRAETEQQARRMAQDNHGDENDVWGENSVTHCIEPWLKDKYTSCVEITQDGPAEMIIRDYRAA